MIAEPLSSLAPEVRRVERRIAAALTHATTANEQLALIAVEALVELLECNYVMSPLLQLRPSNELIARIKVLRSRLHAEVPETNNLSTNSEVK